MALKQLKVGGLYTFDFLDHNASHIDTAWVEVAELGGKPSLIRVSGHVIMNKPYAVTISVSPIRDGQVSTAAFTIVRSTILAIHGPHKLPLLRWPKESE